MAVQDTTLITHETRVFKMNGHKAISRWATGFAIAAVAVLAVLYSGPTSAGAQTCVDDGFEENDTFATATALAAGATTAAHICGLDIDVFKIAVNAGDTIEVTINSIAAQGDIDAWLRRPDFIEVDGTFDPVDVATMTTYATSTGDYFVQVFGDGSIDNSYDITITVIPDPSPCTDDAFEDNDSAQAATPLQRDTPVDATICGIDNDYFGIDLIAGETINIDALFTVNDGAGDIGLALFEPGSGTSIELGTSTPTGETLLHTAQVTGNYKIIVRTFFDEDNTYSIEATVAPPCVDDAAEDNDTFATGAAIVSGVPFDGSVCGDDRDWFLFPVSAGDTVSIEALFIDADGNIDLFVNRPDGSSRGGISTDTDDETFTFLATQTGNYGVELFLPSASSVDGLENTYQLTVTVSGPQCVEDQFEENDIFAEATPISIGQTITAVSCPEDDFSTVSDSDWYTFPVMDGERITLDLQYDAPGDQLFAQLVDPNGGFGARPVADETGNYAVRIDSDNGTAIDYTLTVTTECVDDGFEENDTQQTANRRISGSSPNGTVCPGDQDFFSIRAKAGETINYELFFDHADGDLNFDVFDPLGVLIDSASSTTDNESTTGVATMDGDYAVSIYSADGDINDYLLTLTLIPLPTCDGETVTIFAQPGIPTTGTPNRDVIYGTSGPDTINGLGGDDVICGADGADIISGGNGFDTIFGGPGDDRISGQGDTDELHGEDGNDIINGGTGNDDIYGGDGDDDLRGQAGNDSMYGNADVDQFFGGSGDDTIETGTGGNFGTTQVVRGGGNNDTITGSPDADQLEGGAGLDIINGEGGDDFIKGGLGFDRLNGGDGSDTINGEGSRDIIHGDAGNDTLNGGTGNDDIFGDAGSDDMSGQGDTDLCDGGPDTGDTATTTCETVLGVP